MADAEVQMSRVNIGKALEKALRKRGLPFSTEGAEEGATTIDFEIPGMPADRPVSALVNGDLVVFLIAPDIDIPPHKAAAIADWVLRTNLLQTTATFLFDPDDLWLGARLAVLCSGIPVAHLDGVLAQNWELLAETWRDHAPALLEVLNGRGSHDGAGGEPGDEESEAWDEAVNDLYESLTSAVADYFDEDLAYGLDGSLYALSEEYLTRLLDAEVASVDSVEIETGIAGETAFVMIRSPGAGALRFRFDPTAVRTRMESDAQGLTLYYSAEPAAAKRVLESGFVDEEVSARDYSMDHDGLPVTEDEETVWMAVPLSSEPKPRDDHGARSALLRIDWAGEASDLAEFEQGYTAFSQTDAWIIDGPRRWNVPAALLNEAVRNGRVSISGSDK